MKQVVIKFFFGICYHIEFQSLCKVRLQCQRICVAVKSTMYMIFEIQLGCNTFTSQFYRLIKRVLFLHSTTNETNYIEIFGISSIRPPSIIFSSSSTTLYLNIPRIISFQRKFSRKSKLTKPCKN